MKRLSETCATLYADLKDRACGDTGRLPPGGAFTKKTVNGGIYWYYQTPQVDGQRRQISLGRESDELLAKISAMALDLLEDNHSGVDPASVFVQITALREAEPATA